MKYTLSAKAKIILLLLFFLLSVGSFFYNQYLIDSILEKERKYVELWADAIRLVTDQRFGTSDMIVNKALQEINLSSLDDITYKRLEHQLAQDVGEISDLTTNFAADLLMEASYLKIPTIVVDSNLNVLQRANIEDSTYSDKALVQSFLEVEHEPILIDVGVQGGKRQRQIVYYKESSVVRLLRYYPYFQLGILSLLLVVGYTSFSTIRRHEQSNLWVGMAKEAAHQLGTPITSMYGWVELLKTMLKEEDQFLIAELSNDVSRLQTVAERFNKIGSKPVLKNASLSDLVNHVVGYMDKRLPSLGKGVKIQTQIEAGLSLALSAELLEWALENIIKNAVDALKEKDNGIIMVVAKSVNSSKVVIDISDNGKGIASKDHKNVFRPGYSTKSRGWGLGLSLTKRIIEEYHHGEIVVHNSEVNVGTTFRITLKKTV